MRPANTITVSRSKRGTTVKATGAAAQALFDALASKVDKRLGSNAAVGYTIHFEDHGQDFLEWDVDVTGKVVGCRPSQASVWCGLQVLETPQAGGLVTYLRGGEPARAVRYVIAKITRRITTPTPP